MAGSIQETKKRNQDMAITLLCMGKTVKAVADDLDVTANTVHRWRQDPEFNARLEAYRNGIRQRNADKFSGLVEKAMDVAMDILENGKEASKSKVISSLLNNYVKVETVNKEMHKETDHMSQEEVDARIKLAYDKLKGLQEEVIESRDADYEELS